MITKVLVINDSGFERMVLRDQIRMLGYEVKTADEITGLNMIKSFQPDIVIANLTMGDISGDKLIEHVKSLNTSIRCYLSSCSKIDIKQLDNRYVDGVIETPATGAMLELVLNKPPADHQQPDAAPALYNPVADLSPVQEQAVKTCPSCQKQMEKTETRFAFCPYCGSRL